MQSDTERNPVQTFTHDTYLADESAAYPAGGQTRKGAAIYPDGKVRRVWAGIPDTYFSIPAHGRIGKRYMAGYLTVDDALITCPNRTDDSPGIGSPFHPDGALHCDICQFGLVDSPTRGALRFHPYKRYTDA